MAPPFSSCLAFVFLTGHSDEDIFFSLSLSFKTRHQVQRALKMPPKQYLSSIFPFLKSLPAIILFSLSNNGGHREHTNLRPYLQMRKLKLKEAEMLSQDCRTLPRSRTGACSPELVGRGHPHPPLLKRTPRTGSLQEKNPPLPPTSATEKGLWIR